MKIAENLKSSRFIPKGKKGVALVTVLTVMSLTTILVLTFFSLATSEHQASNTYSNGLQAQQVAEQAVNIVIAQIREATSVGTDIAWASQPGAIRRWNPGMDAEEYAYKLYSDDNMKTQNWGEFETDFLEMNGWSSRPDHFVDLNEPVIRGKKVYYPIVHTQAMDLPEWPAPLNGGGVEGFSYNQRSNAQLTDQGDFGIKAAQALEPSPSMGHLAMPVRWIYQLADGTLGTLAEGGGTVHRFNVLTGEGTPSELNPIVARFAFWADDETSKLNVNTHAGGLAWDVPKAGGALDMNMGRFQPAQKEWQRYPGHPATTHLSPALAPGVLDIVNDREAMEILYNVVPRVVGGGSESGTRVIDTRNPDEANGLVPDSEPLYPSIDDLVMRSDRQPHQFPTAEGGVIQEQELSEYLERAKFFLTVTSRAPETNMFNMPRVAIWPIFNASIADPEYQTKLTAFDRLIHYCASMGISTGGNYPRHDYIFRRENADSTTFDFSGIPRNVVLYNYLLDLMGRTVPGYGNSFAAKYPDGQAQQILTQIFDYIRTTNLHDDSIYGENFDDAYIEGNTDEHLTYTNPRNIRDRQVGQKGHGQVVPIRIDNTKGFGRFYSLGGVQIQVISCAEPGDVPLPANMGARSYRNRNDRPPADVTDPGDRSANVIYPNLPPIPQDFPTFQEADSNPDPNYVAAYLALEPAWLANLRNTNTELYQAAFEPMHWNWQLAYLDPGYSNLVVGDPSTGNPGDPTGRKFLRTSLTPTNFLAVAGGAAVTSNPFTDGETRLEPGEQLVQGALLFNLFTPSIGWGSINPDMEIEIVTGGSGQFVFDGFNPVMGSRIPFIGFANSNRWIFSTNAVDTAWGGRRYGGLMPYEYLLATPWRFNQEMNRILGLPGGGFSTFGGRGRYTWLDRGYNEIPNALTAAGVNGNVSEIADSYRYDLVTVPFKIGGAAPGAAPFTSVPVNFTGGELTFRFFHGGSRSEGSAPQGGVNAYGVDGGELIQEIEVQVDDFSVGGGNATGPLLYHPNFAETFRWDTGAYYNEFDTLSKDSFSFLERNNLGMDPGNPISRPTTRISGSGVANGRFAHISVHRRPSPFSITDIVQSVELIHGDARIAAGKFQIRRGEVFGPHRLYGSQPMAHSVTNAVGADYRGATIDGEFLIRPQLPAIGNRDPYNNRAPLPFGVERSQSVQLYGDFDNGSGLMIDGPYINKPDEGNIHSLQGKWSRELRGHWEERRNYGEFPYFNREWRHESGGPAYFSPNRLVSGPGMFGSLPTGIGRPTGGGDGYGVNLDNSPWRTLLFRPPTDGTEPGYLSHPGAQSPPDHLIMDLFWMPIVEPYAISEPLSTAGKVNMNFEMVPFLHVERSTALRGVFRSEYMLCVPNRWHTDYKHNHGRGRGYHWRDNPFGGELQGKRLRSVIVEDATLEQFYDRFQNGRSIFKSATDICDIHLIPEEITERLGIGSRGSVGSYTPNLNDMQNGKYWQDHSLVGDNSRERPYTNIHNRLTTKSNTFKVHYRAQVLKQARRDSDGEYANWDAERDTVQAEYRGSSVVERFVDPNMEITDFASNPLEGIDQFYQFRVVNPRRFAP